MANGLYTQTGLSGLIQRQRQQVQQEQYHQQLQKQQEQYQEYLQQQRQIEQKRKSEQDRITRELNEWKEAERIVRNQSRFVGTPSLRKKVSLLRELGIGAVAERTLALANSLQLMTTLGGVKPFSEVYGTQLPTYEKQKPEIFTKQQLKELGFSESAIEKFPVKQQDLAKLKQQGMETSISQYKPEYSEQYYRKTFPEALKGFSEISLKDIQQLTKRKPDFRNPFESFKQYGSRTAGEEREKTTTILKEGSISPEEQPYYKKGELEQLGRYGISETEQTGEKIVKASELIPVVVGASTPATSVFYGTYLSSQSEKQAPIQISSVEEGVPLYPDTKIPFLEKAGSTLFIAGGGIGVLGKMGRIEKGLTEAELTRLSEQPTYFTGLQITGEGKTLNILKGTQEYGGLTGETILTGYSEKLGKNVFIMPEAEIKTTIKGELQNLMFKGEPINIFSYQKFLGGTKGVSWTGRETGQLLFGNERNLFLREIASGRVQKGISSSTIIPEYQTSIFYTTKEVPKALYFPSPKLKTSWYFPKLKQKQIEKELFKNLEFLEEEEPIIKSLDTSLSIKVKKNLFFTTQAPEDMGFIKILKLPTKKEQAFKQFRILGGRKSSPDYFKSLYSETIPVSTDIFKPVQEKLIKETIKKIPKTETRFSPIVSTTGKLIKPTQFKQEFNNIIPSGRFEGFEIGGGRIQEGLGGSRFSGLGVVSSGRLGSFEWETQKTSDLEKYFKREKEKTKTKEKERERFEDIVSPKIKTGLGLTPRERLIQRQLEIQKQKERQNQFFQQPQKPRQRTTPKLKTGFPVPELEFPEPKQKIRKKGKREDWYTGEIRRFGKWKPIGEFEKLKIARQRARQRILRGLGASYRIKKGKQVLPLKPKSRFFRPSKKELGVVIQKRKYRLSSMGEKKEIQLAKKKLKFFK